MTLENQVTNLEISKRLKELGVKQESLFYWSRYGTEKILENEYSIHFQKVITEINGKKVEYFSAFTVAELGEMLPAKYISFKGGEDFYWACEFTNEEGYKRSSGSSTEADARGAMLVYLLENKLI